MNYEETIVFLSCRLAEVEKDLTSAINSREYWHKAWKEASDRAADLQLIIDNSASAKEGE